MKVEKVSQQTREKEQMMQLKLKIKVDSWRQ
jgi:hypothetical protein